ncbi:hypothetical protein ACXHXM_30495|uniref:hypothetical protein n=1 Tax=Rhizobium TaxID=379 RepID=UPI001041C0E2|nr:MULTISPECIES: hypothetical protein [Rhizobium]
MNAVYDFHLRPARIPGRHHNILLLPTSNLVSPAHLVELFRRSSVACLMAKRSRHSTTAGLERRPGEPSIPFTPQQAREMTDELGYLHQVVRTRLRTIDRLFTDESYDRIAWLPQIGREIRSLSRQLESKPADPTLARIDAEARERKERAERAISDDPFFESSSANSPVVVPEASSSQSSLRRCDGMSPDDDAFLRSRRRFDEYSRRSSPARDDNGETSAPRKRARTTTTVGNRTDAEEKSACEPAAGRVPGPEHMSLQGSSHTEGSSAANDRTDEAASNQRCLRERERTRSAGLDY